MSLNFLICLSLYLQTGINDTYRDGEWYLEKRGSRKIIASHAGIFRGARISSLVGREEIRAPLKTPSWEARKTMAGSRNRGSVFDESRSLVFPWFVFICVESRNFLPKSLGLGFLTRISASRRLGVSASPGFYDLPPLHILVSGKGGNM